MILTRGEKRKRSISTFFFCLAKHWSLLRERWWILISERKILLLIPDWRFLFVSERGRAMWIYDEQDKSTDYHRV